MLRSWPELLDLVHALLMQGRPKPMKAHLVIRRRLFDGGLSEVSQESFLCDIVCHDDYLNY